MNCAACADPATSRAHTCVPAPKRHQLTAERRRELAAGLLDLSGPSEPQASAIVAPGAPQAVTRPTPVTLHTLPPPPGVPSWAERRELEAEDRVLTALRAVLARKVQRLMPADRRGIRAVKPIELALANELAPTLDAMVSALAARIAATLPPVVEQFERGPNL